MGANVSMHCFENTQKPFDCCTKSKFRMHDCFCCYKPPPVHDPHYCPNVMDQLVLLPNQFKCDCWIVLDDIPFTSVTVFFMDSEKRLRALIHNEPHERIHRLSIHQDEHENKERDKLPDVKGGLLMEDILPAHVRVPLMYIMTDTINNGHYYQLNGLFHGVSRLIRTFPLPDADGNIVAGVMMIGIFTQKYDKQLNQFVLNPRDSQQQPVAEKEDAKRKSIDNEVQQLRPIDHLGKKLNFKTL